MKCLLERVVMAWLQVVRQSEGEYEVRLCVEEAGLIVTRHKAPTTTCTVILTSPILREQLIAASPGMPYRVLMLVEPQNIIGIFRNKSAFAYFLSYCI